MTLNIEGRELDALVAERVMGWGWQASYKSGKRWFAPPEHCGDLGSEHPATMKEEPEHPWWLTAEPTENIWVVPYYSTDISAAWTVLQKFCDEESANYPQDVLVEWNGFHWFCYVNTEQMLNPELQGKADTAPEAICRAALKAVE